MLDAYPSLKDMHAADDSNIQVFYFRNATATIRSFTHEPETNSVLIEYLKLPSANTKVSNENV